MFKINDLEVVFGFGSESRIRENIAADFRIFEK